MGVVGYLMVGTAFAFTIDVSSNLAGAKAFNTLERIICIISWPITMPLFIIAVIKEFFKQNKDD
jgi:hypothetical protein|tara:strand:+ start:131 stop:322 length:192 start_codon:yes stop_codon:yes gene_type:complete